MSRAILFSFAHPDDESFSGAGTSMLCAAAGVRTVLVTATLGERGKAGDPPVCTPEELPAVRERELREAARIIGFDELHLLGYRDRELSEAAPDEIRRKLVAIVRRVRPAVVLTFDPNGFNVHPDHVAISRFTSDALSAAADPRWHPDTGDPHVVSRLLWTPPLAPWDAALKDWATNDHASALKGWTTNDEASAGWTTKDASVRGKSAPAGIDFVVDVSAWRERRIAALRAHRTQHLSIDRYFFSQPDLDTILAREFWRHAWGARLGQRPSGNIFEGLDGT
jgi:LmbE family N-acetylglucosaminyl deacetylase